MNLTYNEYISPISNVYRKNTSQKAIITHEIATKTERRVPIIDAKIKFSKNLIIN
jgi:hypothetical protein